MKQIRQKSNIKNNYIEDVLNIQIENYTFRVKVINKLLIETQKKIFFLTHFLLAYRAYLASAIYGKIGALLQIFQAKELFSYFTEWDNYFIK